MWHFFDKENNTEIVGTRAEIVKALNIFTVYNEETDEEELCDYHRPSHWARIVREYELVGDDD